MKIFTSLSCLCLMVIICACGQPARVQTPVAREARTAESVSSYRAKLLYKQYREWRGVRYKYGGLSKKGVDCSGFVYLTYRDKFGRKIPRTTAKLAVAGKSVKRQDLRAGDLVFFKTGGKKRHVGIYIEKNKFVHASTSKGVIISSLDNVYWRGHYRHARRL